jgi:hypothetical protein
MPKRIDKLTDQKIMEAVPREKPRKLFDGAGLYVMLLPSGLMSWRMKYRDQRDKEMTLTLGHYPDVSLELARDRSSAAREMLKAGMDPRKKFDRAHLRPPIRITSRRLLPVSIDKKKLGFQVGEMGRKSLDSLAALVFPTVQRLSADGSGQSKILALLEKAQSERGKEVAELLYDICAEVIRNCLDAEIDERVLIAGMTDARVKRRRMR